MKNRHHTLKLAEKHGKADKSKHPGSIGGQILFGLDTVMANNLHGLKNTPLIQR